MYGYGLIFLQFAAFLVILTLGIVGWLQSLHSHFSWGHFWDATYGALQLFPLNYNPPLSSRGWKPSWLLNTVRFLAPLLVPFAFILKFVRPVRAPLLDYLNSYTFKRGRLISREQYLIIGYGRVGQGLARALKLPGPRIVALDRHVRPLDRQEAKLSETELYEADARDIRSIRAAPFRLAAARRIFVAIGDDQQTIATASAIVKEVNGAGEHVWMQLNDPTLLDRLRNAPVFAKSDAPHQIRSFSLAEAAGVELIARYRPALMARALGQNRLHAVLIRFDNFAWSMAEALVLAGTTPPPRLSRPRLTIVDSDADSIAQRWRARHPDLWRWADFTFVQTDPASLSWSGPEPLLDRVEALDPPTLYIFSRDRTGAAMPDTLSLRLGMEKGERQPVPVLLTSDVDGIETLATHEVKADLQDRLVIIGRAGEIAKYSHAIEPESEQLVMALHEDYRKRHGGSDFAGQQETLQVSNRRAALHIVQILAYLGFEQVDIHKRALGLSATAVKHLLPLFPERGNSWPLEPDVADACAKYEHLRWCVDRVVDGWQVGLRDNEARRRKQLAYGRYEYEHLPDDEKEKDKEQMRAAAAFLADRCTENDNEFDRIIEKFGAIPPLLCWSSPGAVLRLDFANTPDWRLYRPADPSLHARVILQVPPEPPLRQEDEDPAHREAETPADRGAAPIGNSSRTYWRKHRNVCISVWRAASKRAGTGWATPTIGCAMSMFREWTALPSRRSQSALPATGISLNSAPRKR